MGAPLWISVDFQGIWGGFLARFFFFFEVPRGPCLLHAVNTNQRDGTKNQGRGRKDPNLISLLKTTQIQWKSIEIHSQAPATSSHMPGGGGGWGMWEEVVGAPLWIPEDFHWI